MIRLSPGDKLVIASHNMGKVREIRELLEPYRLDVIGAADLRLDEPEETGSTFAENAILKAEAAHGRRNAAFTNLSKAFARCEIACFSFGSNLAKVNRWPSGMKIGS